MHKKWDFERARNIFSLPFMELIYDAHTVHKSNFDANKIQISTLLSIKTGSCPENCAYCPQSAHYNTGLKKEPMIEINKVIDAAKNAKLAGATRFCMGGAWRSPHQNDIELICEMILEVKKIGLETCVTLGMLKETQVEMLKNAGLDFYNHNIDTSEEFYPQIITTRTFQDRLDTLNVVRKAGIKICCGGIIGMGETNEDRIKMLLILANLDFPPESIPINRLIKVPGTPLENMPDVDVFDFIRIIALARIMVPSSYIRLSAGREQMSDEMQALCFIAGANSIFYGEKLLTAANASLEHDDILFNKLGITKYTM